MRNYTQRTKSDYFGKRKGLFYDGRELGKRLADEMGFSYYAKEIIGKIAENLELGEQYIESVLDRADCSFY